MNRAAFAPLICILAAMTMLAVGGCTRSSDKSSDTTPTPADSPATQQSTGIVPNRQQIDLQCSGGQTGLVPDDNRHHGVATPFFFIPEDPSTDIGITPAPMWDRSYYFLKSPIYVFGDASKKTHITVLEPATARLYYTDWTTWKGPKTEEEQRALADGASTAITVPRCGKDVWGWPGELLLEGPACVKLRLTGEDPDWEATLIVPEWVDHEC